MDSVLRGLVVYIFLLIVFRLSGRRTLADVTTFDFVLLLIIAETTQQALLGDDFSITNAGLLVITLLGFDILLSLVKRKFPKLDRVLEGLPMIVVEEGKPCKERMEKARIDEGDVLHEARKLQGLERMEQIKYAVLERNGGITIVPKPEYR